MAFTPPDRRPALFRSILIAGLALLLIAAAADPAHAGERERVDALTRQMMQLYSQGRFAEATPLAVEILSTLQKALGPETPEVASALNNLAELYAKQRRFTDAEPLYRRSLAIREKLLGPDHPDSVKSRDRLADLMREEDREAPTASQPRPPAAPSAAAMPPPAPQPRPAPVARPAAANPASQDLAIAYQKTQQANELSRQGRVAEAIPLAKESLAVLEKTLGPDNKNVAIVLVNLANYYSDQEQYDLAEPLYKRSLTILDKLGPTSESDRAYALSSFGNLYARQHRATDAEPLYRQAIPLLDKVYGPTNPNTVTVVNNLAAMDENEGRKPDSDPLIKGRWTPHLRMATGIDVPPVKPPATMPPPNPADLDQAKQTEHQVFALTSQGKFAEALTLAQQNQTLLEKMYGPDSLAAAVNLDTIAGIDKSLGHNTEAEALAARSQTIRNTLRAAAP